MAIAASAQVLPNQKKTVLQNRPIHWRTLYKNNSRLDSLLSDTIIIIWALVSFVLLVLLSTYHHSMSRPRVDDA